MSGFSFTAWPFLVLLVLLPLGWVWARRRRVRLPLPGSGGRHPAGWKARVWWWWTPVWRTAALALMALALASPRRTMEKVERESRGISIMLAVDISSSMLAGDFKPQNRVAVAKREVARFVTARDKDRLGLVAFAGEALTVVPGTLDHLVLEQAVENLDVGQLEDGTAIGTALATAINRLRHLENEDREERGRRGRDDSGSRVVVLLTDGDNNRGEIDPLEAAAAARALGVRVYTIGVGRDGVAPVPIGRTRFGYQYADMRVMVNDDLLTQIAETTGGLYFRATDPDALSRIYDRIDELETAPLREIRTVDSTYARSGLVIAALICLALELIGSATRARRTLAW